MEECRICAEGFGIGRKGSWPRMLMCGHFFCARCLGELLANSGMDQSIVCPLDRTVTGPLTDVHKNLPPYLPLIQTLPLAHQQGEGRGSSTSTSRGGAGMCVDHKQAFQGYDVECGRLVCDDCVLRGEHNGHKFKALDEIGAEWFKEVEEVMGKYGRAMEGLEQRAKAVEHEERRVNQMCDDAVNTICAGFARLRQELVCREKALCSRVEEERKNKRFELLDQQRCISALRGCLQQMRRTAEEAVGLYSSEPQPKKRKQHKRSSSTLSASAVERIGMVREQLVHCAPTMLRLGGLSVVFGGDDKDDEPSTSRGGSCVPQHDLIDTKTSRVERSKKRTRSGTNDDNQKDDGMRAKMLKLRIDEEGEEAEDKNKENIFVSWFDVSPLVHSIARLGVEVVWRTPVMRVIDTALELMHGLGRQQINWPAASRMLQELNAKNTTNRRALVIGLLAETNCLNTSQGQGRALYLRALEARLKDEAEQGDAIGQWLFGRVHRIGVVKRDDAAAVEWYRRAADQGLSMAQYCLGNAYCDGRGVGKDYKTAVMWYRKSADQNHAAAQSNLGFMYEKGYGVEQDYASAVMWYRKSADQNNAVAQSNLGLIYDAGSGVEQDYKTAAMWYRKSAEQNHPDGQFNLGFMYERGHGVEQDYGAAVMWYRKSADQNHSDGQFKLGLMYEEGNGIEQDYEAAVLWYRKSAKRTNTLGQSKLGFMYEKGYGVEQDYNTALKWYQKSADRNDPHGLAYLGSMYERGKGIDKDHVRARELYEKAAAQGSDFAKRRLAKLKK